MAEALATFPAGPRLISIPHIDPMRDRIDVTVAPNTTIAEMVALALPGLPPSRRDMVRVTINDYAIPAAHWPRVRPKPGTVVVIRLVPGKDTLRNVLTIVVAIAAIVVAPYIAGPLAAAFNLGAFGTSVLTAVTATAVPCRGGLLMNALCDAGRAIENHPTKEAQ